MFFTNGKITASDITETATNTIICTAILSVTRLVINAAIPPSANHIESSCALTASTIIAITVTAIHTQIIPLPPLYIFYFLLKHQKVEAKVSAL